MKKLMCNVLLPATGLYYEFDVRDDMTVQQATEVIAEEMQRREPSFYRKTPDAALMLVDTGQVQVPTASIINLNLSDGVRFALV